jgi:putative intracellular protease/amidase
MIDYPHAKGLQKIAIQIWTQGGMVCSVCHGPAIFPGVIDPETGKSVAYGKTFTGFGTQGEEMMGLSATLKSWNVPWVEDVAKELGATCTSIFNFVSIRLYLFRCRESTARGS